ncbi:hypothetical protein N185_32360 [Sinorhizobium sp. GW3]|nr:hypothetical protein N185_32360 [Sinorhizobium sp. GW3]
MVDKLTASASPRKLDVGTNQQHQCRDQQFTVSDA